MNIVDYLHEFRDELENAERKFPSFPTDPVHAAAIVAEESGELVQAALQYTYEGGGFLQLRKEAIQTGAMALRFLLHLDDFAGRPSEQVERLRTALNTRNPSADANADSGTAA